MSRDAKLMPTGGVRPSDNYYKLWDNLAILPRTIAWTRKVNAKNEVIEVSSYAVSISCR